MSATDDIAHAADLLREGSVVAFPTETVYGLGADAFNAEAVRRVYRLKGRPSCNPLIVHVAGPEMARRVVSDWTPEAGALARAFWPGPLSIVLPKAPELPDIVTAGAPTVAVRAPDHPVTLALLFRLGRPLVGPSANPSGSVSPTTAAHVRAAFGEADVYVLEGGPCRGGIESTVVDLTGPRPRVLRPGVIGPAELAFTIGRPVEMAAGVHSPESGAAPSPGMLARHYAPATRARLFGPDEWPRVLPPEGRAAVVITHRPRAVQPPHVLLQMPADPEGYAAMLYSALREADARGGAVILIERPEGEGPIWDAIADRLRRATA